MNSPVNYTGAAPWCRGGICGSEKRRDWPNERVSDRPGTCVLQDSRLLVLSLPRTFGSSVRCGQGASEALVTKREQQFHLKRILLTPEQMAPPSYWKPALALCIGKEEPEKEKLCWLCFACRH